MTMSRCASAASESTEAVMALEAASLAIVTCSSISLLLAQTGDNLLTRDPKTASEMLALIAACQANSSIEMNQLLRTVTLAGIVTPPGDASVCPGLCWKGESGSILSLNDSFMKTKKV